MQRSKGKRRRRTRVEDSAVNCRLLCDEGNNQMKLGNEHKAMAMYAKVKFLWWVSFYYLLMCQYCFVYCDCVCTFILFEKEQSLSTICFSPLDHFSINYSSSLYGSTTYLNLPGLFQVW